MYGNTHECEVHKQDVEDLRYDLERRIDQQGHEISRLEARVKSYQEDNNHLWVAIQELQRGK